MKVFQEHINAASILAMYDAVANAPEINVRGQRTRNVHNACIVLDADELVITDFKARKMSIAYARREWLWYLTGDRYDESICQHATMWAKLKQADGSFYSNYGQYLFGKLHTYDDAALPKHQFEYVINTLANDPNSRRASMVLLNPRHLYEANTDLVCTYAINFTIERGYLHMTVMMRSNDIIYGFTNDAFCFGNLYNFVLAILKYNMPSLRAGKYTHMSNSMHVYEKHFSMIEDIVAAGLEHYQPHHVPIVSASEAVALIQSGGRDGKGDYTDWLKANL